MEKIPTVYIMASKRNGTMYVGVTSELRNRIWKHKNKVIKGFTSMYSISMLVWYEVHSTMDSAIAGEKQIKKWNREWKIKLVEKNNPKWKDLWFTI